MIQNEEQRQADKAHHEGRIAWLGAERPLWACGTPVARHAAQEMINKSREALRLINEHGMSTNSAKPVCQRIMSDGLPCGLPPGCPDCGRCLVDVPDGCF